MQQLGFAFRPGPVRVFADVYLPQTDQRLYGESEPDGIRVVVEGPDEARSAELILRTRGRVKCLFNGEPREWCLEPELRHLGHGEAFIALLSTIRVNDRPTTHMDQLRLSCGWFDGAPFRPLPLETMLDGLRLRSWFIRTVYAEALAACDPAILRTLRDLPSGLRWTAYEVCEGDRTRRLGQLVRSTPGALTFVFGLRSQLGSTLARPVCDRFSKAIISGARPKDALIEPLHAWMRHGVGNLRGDSPAWNKLAESSELEQERTLVRQWLLIRRAPAGVPATELLVPRVFDTPPEDVPPDTGGACAWHTVTNEAARILSEPGCPMSDGQKASLISFASKNAVAIATDQELPIELHLRRMIAYCQDTGRSIRRESSYQKLKNQVRAFHARESLLLALRQLLRTSRMDPRAMEYIATTRIDENTVLPGAPVFPEVDDPKTGFSVRRIRRLGDVFAAGVEMKNCLRGTFRAMQALTGKDFFYWAQLGTEKVLVEASVNEAFVEVEAKGFANAAPSLEAWEQIHRWCTQYLPHGLALALEREGVVCQGFADPEADVL